MKDPGSQPARFRERQVVELVAAFADAEVTDWPEESRTRFPGLSTDAVVRVADGECALDVTALVPPIAMVETHEAAEQYFGDLARAEGLSVEVVVTSTVHFRRARWRSRLFESIRQSPDGGSWRTAEGLEVAWNTSTSPEARVITRPVDGATADLVEQVRASMTMLDGKQQQLIRARQRGLGYWLAFDADAHAGVRQGNHWLVRHQWTFMAAIQREFRSLSWSPDRCLLVWRGEVLDVVDELPE